MKKQSGFTLIEMLVIAPIVILAIGAFITAVISLTGEVLSSRATNVLIYSVQDALNRIDHDVKLSTAFLAENNITPQNGQGSGDNTTAFVNVGGPTGTVLILDMVAVTGNPATAGSDIVYLADQPNACGSSSVTSNVAMNINVVYFVKNDPVSGVSSLWRRTIMPSNYASAGCSKPWERPSCVPGYNPGTYTFCKTNDVKLIEGVSSSGFSISYFSDPLSSSANSVASDSGQSAANRGAALLTTPTIDITISASQTVAGRTISQTSSLRTSQL